MKRFHVKVCGITRAKDAERAAQLGGDMIGFIFFRPSPRYVTPARAHEICSCASPVLDRVGVFVDEDLETILRIARRVRLNIIQLHGKEPVRAVTRLQREGYRVIKAFGIAHARDYERLRASPADLVMLDAAAANLPGGTGRTFDWSVRPRPAIPNLVLAGGITARNVARGVKLFDPTVVDVNSGVESAAGVKSPRKLKEFFDVCNRLRYGG
ncbi:MAG TPA: phosphoribosylanthranilate isomerase [Acidobacteriota bacterium]|nr:phosphoribosylanthranilate isomerase [Acidobacteriota bacterium]